MQEMNKETANELAELNKKMDELLFFIKHIHYTNTFGDGIKNKSEYYQDFSRELNTLRNGCSREDQLVQSL